MFFFFIFSKYGIAASNCRCAEGGSNSAKIVPSDAIFVLGGDDKFRLIKASELSLSGASSVILVAGVRPGIDLRSLFRLCEAQVKCFESCVNVIYIALAKSTWYEVDEIIRTSQIHNWKSIIVVTDPPHVPRVKWVLSKKPSHNIQIQVIASNPPWWRDGVHFQSIEAIKFSSIEMVKRLWYMMRY